MENYKNLSGNSGVRAYEIGINHINVLFSNGNIYTYSYLRAGASNVEHMKQLARLGRGLNSFIKRNVNDKYD